MNTPNAQVSAVKHKDVRGKEQLYLVITTEHDSVIINIGNKTYEKVAKMMESPLEIRLVDDTNKPDE